MKQGQIFPKEMYLPNDPTPLCGPALCLVLGISKKTFHRYKNEAIHGPTGVPPVLARHSSNTMHAITWLKSFSEQNGEQMPHVNCVNLPSWMIKNDIFLMYEQECNVSTIHPISKVQSMYSKKYSTFVNSACDLLFQ